MFQLAAHPRIADGFFCIAVMVALSALRWLLCGRRCTPSPKKGTSNRPPNQQKEIVIQHEDVFEKSFRFLTSWHKRELSYPCLIDVCERFVKPGKLEKFIENAWYFLWHTVAFASNAVILKLEGLSSEAPGWTRLTLTQRNTYWCFHATPAETLLHGSTAWPFLHVTEHVRIFYLVQLSFWMYCFIRAWAETKRKDFNIFITHHILTIFLVVLSYLCNFIRFGLLVLFIHDVGDVFLYLTKSLVCLQVPKKVSEAMFACFSLIFFVTRLIIFPLYLIVGGFKTTTMPLLAGKATTLTYMAFCLLVLQVMHIFWFSLILKMILGAIRGVSVSDTGDIRSEDGLSASSSPTGVASPLSSSPASPDHVAVESTSKQQRSSCVNRRPNRNDI